MKIKVKEITEGCMPEIIDKGDWIDLRSAEDINFIAPQSSNRKRKYVNGTQVSFRNIKSDLKLIRLGVAMKLPKGFEAVILPRSSTPFRFGIICANSQGVIDGKTIL